MIRIALLAVALMIPLTARADAPKDQLLANVTRELPHFVPGVDTSTLRRSQLAAIYSIIHGGRNDGDKGTMIRSVLGGQYSLRALLFDR